MNFVWIFIGVIYLIYMFCRDSDVKGFLYAASHSKDTPETLKQKLSDCGYNVSDKAIELLFSSPLSPMRSQKKFTVTMMDCFNWLCDQYTWKIDKLSCEDISNRLGVPLDKIPLDSSLPLGEASLKRTTLAKDHLLRKEGLRYVNFKHYLNESDEYYTVFVNFVDEYISEHCATMENAIDEFNDARR